MRASSVAATLSSPPIYDDSLPVQCDTLLLGRQATTRRNAPAVRSAQLTG